MNTNSASHGVEETIIPIQEMDTNSTSHGAEETKIPIQEWMRVKTESLETDFSNNETKIHRFPQGLRWIGGQGDRYIVPSVVALGPYHHGRAHLQKMEEVKPAAAQYFCLKSRHSAEEVYGKILSIASEARGCYDDGDAAVTRFSDAEFATMIFLDGCFLLWYISRSHEPALLFNRMTLSTGPCMSRDIFLLENQLPWLVLEALMTFTSVPIYRFIFNASSAFDAISVSELRLSEDEFLRYKPPHLLGLFRYYHIGAMPPKDHSRYEVTYLALASSAIDLAEIGIKVTASKKRWFADMSILKGCLTGELSLTPLFLNDFTACWLVNMAAFEACMSTDWPSDGYTISSYISLLAMLMDKEEDVHELRAKHLVRSFFSNHDLLDFFKGFACHVRIGCRYHVALDEIDGYKRDRCVRIAMHKFIYKNFKTIATLLSITGVLVGIFKTLLDLKQR